MRIISATERLAEQSGAKILIVGPTGVGKTSLMKTLSDEMLTLTALIDIEAGTLALGDLPITTARPRTWSDCCDIAAVVGGPNPALPATSFYSEAHFNSVMATDTARLADFEIVFVDSLTEAARLSFTHAEQQPEAVSDRGKKDLRSVYGLHARQMTGWLRQLQQGRSRHVVLVAILEKIVDEFNRAQFEIQMEGSKTSRELPGIVDEVLCMNWVDFGDGKLARAFVCTSPNPWGWPAKDRSGRLEQIEKPHLGEMISKLTSK